MATGRPAGVARSPKFMHGSAPWRMYYARRVRTKGFFMKRTTIAPPDPGEAPLRALKQWLAISTGQDDAALIALIHTALEICEAFTGALPLAATCEELLGPARDWQWLATRPVQAILGVEAVAADGSRTVLPPESYALEMDADGTGRVRLRDAIPANRVAVRFIAGMAADWAGLPEALRHGIIRFAAQQFQSRDSGSDRVPPASVTALWRPWRRLRVA